MHKDKEQLQKLGINPYSVELVKDLANDPESIEISLANKVVVILNHDKNCIIGYKTGDKIFAIKDDYLEPIGFPRNLTRQDYDRIVLDKDNTEIKIEGHRLIINMQTNMIICWSVVTEEGFDAYASNPSYNNELDGDNNFFIVRKKKEYPYGALPFQLDEEVENLLEKGKAVFDELTFIHSLDMEKSKELNTMISYMYAGEVIGVKRRVIGIDGTHWYYIAFRKYKSFLIPIAKLESKDV